MSDKFDKICLKLITKFLVIIFILGFIVFFQQKLISDPQIKGFFSSLMGNLPFASTICTVIQNLIDYQGGNIPIITTDGVIEDILKLAFMAVVQPPIIALFTKIFLKLPKIDIVTSDFIDLEESSMDKLSYRLKEMLINVIITPLTAVGGAWLFSKFMKLLNKISPPEPLWKLINSFAIKYFPPRVGNFFYSHYKIVWASFILVLLIIAATIFMRKKTYLEFFREIVIKNTNKMSFLRAFIWRAFNLAWKMLYTLGLEAVCLWIYISFVGDLASQFVASIIVLFIYLIAMDLISQPLKKFIGSLF